MPVTDTFHTVIEPIIKEAGALILSFFRQPSMVWKKKKNSSLVTQADYESESYLINTLRNVKDSGIKGDVSFLAEETGEQGTGDYCWVIDPIDGTSNFINKIPYFCISLALFYKEIPLFGAIYQPVTDEYFYAYHQKGAFLNGMPITVSPEAKCEQRVFIVGSPATMINRRNLLGLLRKETTYHCNTVAYRYFGSAALDQAYVAAGRLEAVYFRHLEWWDIAAGMLLIEQAGGMVSDFKGDKKTVEGDHSYLAGNPLMYKVLSKIIKKQLIL